MAIRVTLLHNPGAGFEQYSKEELLKILQQNGYETHYTDVKTDNLAEELHHPADFLVVAGGDGTVIKVAKQLVGRNIPLGLLPLGTANNIASGLGLCAKPEDIIPAWNMDRRRPFNLGLAKGPHGETIFLESAGFGLLPRLIRQHSSDKNGQSDREDELEKALRHQQDILKEYKPHHCSIEMDGRQLSGKYLLVEIMNIPLAGPNMALAPHADSGDSQLDVVLVREDEREKLAKHLSDQISEKGKPLELNVQRAKKLRIEWDGHHYHLDDEAFENDSPLRLEITLMPKGLEFLMV